MELLNTNLLSISTFINQDVINIVSLLALGGLAIGLIGVIKSLAMNESSGKKKLIMWFFFTALFYGARYFFAAGAA